MECKNIRSLSEYLEPIAKVNCYLKYIVFFHIYPLQIKSYFQEIIEIFLTQLAENTPPPNKRDK